MSAASDRSAAVSHVQVIGTRVYKGNIGAVVNILSPKRNDTSKILKFKKRHLLRCIHHFKSDSINDMDHMRISGTEPSSVILSQTCSIKS